MSPRKAARSVRPRRAPNKLPPPARDLDGMLKRLHLPTVRRLYGELATRAEAEGMGYRVYLETLVAEEIAHRADARDARGAESAVPVSPHDRGFQLHLPERAAATDARQLPRARAGERAVAAH